MESKHETGNSPQNLRKPKERCHVTSSNQSKTIPNSQASANHRYLVITTINKMIMECLPMVHRSTTPHIILWRTLHQLSVTLSTHPHPHITFLSPAVYRFLLLPQVWSGQWHEELLHLESVLSSKD